MTKTLIVGMIIASWAAPLGQSKPKHAAREYVATFVSVPDRSPNYKGFNRVIGVNARGDALIHSCQVYSDGAPCRLYLWSEKDGLQPVGLQPCSMGSCQMSLTGTEVLLNDRGEVGGHVATSVLVWSKHNGVQTLGSVNVFSASHPPTAAFNNRAEVAGTTYVPPGPLQPPNSAFQGFFASEKSGVQYFPCPGLCQPSAMSDHSEVIAGGFYWTLEEGLIDLASRLGGSAHAITISKKGLVLGAMTEPNGPRSYFLWERRRGLIEKFAMPPDCVASSINSSGQVLAQCGSQVWIWREGLGARPIGNLGYDAISYAQNESGEVVGASRAAPVGPEHAFVWSLEDGMIDLDPGRPDRAGVARHIGDDGMIGGEVVDPPFTTWYNHKPVIWTIEKK